MSIGGSYPRYTQTSQVFTFEDNYIEQQNVSKSDVVHSGGGDVDTYFFRFRSPHGNTVFPDSGGKDSAHPRFDNRANRTFMAKLYAPRDRTSLAAILFNGLDETVWRMREESDLYGFYDDLGRHLASQGILTVLLPTPYHMNRALAYANRKSEQGIRRKFEGRKDAVYVDYIIPTNALMRTPQNIYENHFHGFKETVALCKCFNRKDFTDAFPDLDVSDSPVSHEVRDLFRDKLDEHPQISLVGYSLGGLRSLTEFIHDRLRSLEKKRPPLFSSCVSINSGGALSDLPAPHWVDRDSWETMINRLVLAPPSDTRTDGILKADRSIAENHFTILEDVFLGKARALAVLEASGERVAAETLFILGGADELVGLDNLKRFDPSGGINLLQVARVGHMFRYGAWGRWKDTVCSLISDFIVTTCESRRMPSAERIASFVALFDHTFGILHYLENTEKEKAWKQAKKSLESAWAEMPATQVLGEQVVSELKKQLDEQRVTTIDSDFSAYAAMLLHKLTRLIQEKKCHPGVYKTARRELLFGWHVLKDRSFVDQWEVLAKRAQANGKRIGEIMREDCAAPPFRVSQAERTHDAALKAVQTAMAADFRSRGMR